MGRLPGAPGSCPNAVVEQDAGQMTGLFRGGAGGTEGLPGHCSPGPVDY